MKFGQLMLDSARIAWGPYYMDYQRSKALLKELVDARVGAKNMAALKARLRSPRDEFVVVPASAAPQAGDKPLPEEVKFFEQLAADLEKVDNFYNEQLKALATRLRALIVQTRQLLEPSNLPRQINSELFDIARAACKHHGRELSALRDFVRLNSVGFSKILRKFDTVLRAKIKGTYMAANVINRSFYRSRSLNELVARTQVLLQQLEQGHAACQRQSVAVMPSITPPENTWTLRDRLCLAATRRTTDDLKALLSEVAPPPTAVSAFVHAVAVLDAQTAPVGLQQALDTAFLIACDVGQHEHMRLLLSHGACIDAANQCEQTGLMDAARRGDHVTVKMLLDAGAKAALRDYAGRQAVHLAAFCEQVETVRVLCEYDAALADARDGYGRTPLHYLCVAAGAFANAQRAAGSAETISARGMQTMQALLDFKADVRRQDLFGMAPLHMAAFGAQAALALLIQHGADVNAATLRGDVPLHTAAVGGHLACVLTLLENKARPTERDKRGRSPLHHAAYHNWVDVAAALLGSVADAAAYANVIEFDFGWSPLHFAAFQGHVAATEALLKASANPHVRDQWGWTPRIMAFFHGHLALGSMLREKEELTAQDPAARDAEFSSGSSSPTTDLDYHRLNSDYQSESNHATPAGRSPPRDDDAAVGDQITVTFQVHADGHLRSGRELCVVGDCEALGAWDPLRAVPMHLLEGDDSEEHELEEGDETYEHEHDAVTLVAWTAKIVLPSSALNTPIRYKYVVRDGDSLDKWETLPGNRLVVPINAECFADDGVFGRRHAPHHPGEETGMSAEWVEHGWLVNDTQVNLRLPATSASGASGVGVELPHLDEYMSHMADIDPGKADLIRLFDIRTGKSADTTKPAIVLYDKLERVESISVTTAQPNCEPTVVNLPLTAEKQMQFRGQPADGLYTLYFEVRSRAASMIIGRATVLPAQLAARRGMITVPLIDSAMRAVGEITFDYLIVTPFKEANLSSVLSRTFTKSTKVFGHRGNGASAYSKITENTILSFVTAASLGAEYVEFDVQLTKDHVPVIYHNFAIEVEAGLEMPITQITLEQFRRIRKPRDEPPMPSTGGHGHGAPPPTAAAAAAQAASPESLIKRVKRSRSMEDISESGRGKVDASRVDANRIWDVTTTLVQVFEEVPVSTGFNVEIKYPTKRDYDMYNFDAEERNQYVDTILKVIFEKAGSRRIMFSCFDPDVCILLSLKQPRYPVFFLTTSGVLINLDQRRNSLKNAIDFARSANLLGIVTDCTPLNNGPDLCKVVKENGLLLCSYGTKNNDVELVKQQQRNGVDVVIVDHVAQIFNATKASKREGKPPLVSFSPDTRDPSEGRIQPMASPKKRDLAALKKALQSV